MIANLTIILGLIWMEACRKWAYILKRNKKLEATSHTFLLICSYQMWGTGYVCYLLLILANSIYIYIKCLKHWYLVSQKESPFVFKTPTYGLIIWKKEEDILDQPKISLRERGQSYTICTKDDNENVVDYIWRRKKGTGKWNLLDGLL